MNKTEEDDDPAPPPKRTAPKLVGRKEKAFIYLILLALTCVLVVFQSCDAKRQQTKYEQMLSFASEQYKQREMSEANYIVFVATVAPAEDMLALRHITSLLGFIVIGLGCMFVLTGIEAAYELKVEGRDINSAFKTASPGLVLITFGVVLMIIGVERNTKLEIEPEHVPRVSVPAVPEAQESNVASDPIPKPSGTIVYPDTAVDAGDGD